MISIVCVLYFHTCYEHRAAQVQNKVSRRVIVKEKKVIVQSFFTLIEQGVPERISLRQRCWWSKKAHFWPALLIDGYKKVKKWSPYFFPLDAYKSLSTEECMDWKMGTMH